MDNLSSKNFLDKGKALICDGMFYARCFEHEGIWTLWINGAPVAGANTRSELFNLLAQILLCRGED